uniref:SLC3A2_N domain-containing protein n=1 Tax=Ascaris lumbricoides TaxID=6252 RepID=A0A0M3IIZ7_ASCLU
MENETIWLIDDMVHNETASTSSTFEHSDSAVTLQYDRIVELFNNSSMITPNVTTNDDLVKALNIWNIFEELPWLIWAIVAIGVIAVIGVVAAIITCIIWNKK